MASHATVDPALLLWWDGARCYQVPAALAGAQGCEPEAIASYLDYGNVIGPTRLSDLFRATRAVLEQPGLRLVIRLDAGCLTTFLTTISEDVAGRSTPSIRPAASRWRAELTWLYVFMVSEIAPVLTPLDSSPMPSWPRSVKAPTICSSPNCTTRSGFISTSRINTAPSTPWRRRTSPTLAMDLLDGRNYSLAGRAKGAPM